MSPLSAVLITRDEEHNLPAALASASFCDEILVVDSGSQDRTREIAAAAGARVIVNAPWPGFTAQRNLAADAARHDWILALDADERVTPALRAEIVALRARGFDRAGYRIPRVARYLGRWIRGTDWFPDPQLRLFDRRQARWGGGRVHESVRARGPVGRLAGEIEHHPYTGIADHLQSIDTYTTLWAEEAHERGRRTGALELALVPAWAFARNYLVRRGVLLGRVGLVVSVLNSYYTFAKLAKLLERSQAASVR